MKNIKKYENFVNEHTDMSDYIGIGEKDPDDKKQKGTNIIETTPHNPLMEQKVMDLAKYFLENEENKDFVHEVMIPLIAKYVKDGKKKAYIAKSFYDKYHKKI